MTSEECNRIDDYLDEELSATELEMFRRHLSECESCRQGVTLTGELEQALVAYAETLEPSIPIQRPVDYIQQTPAPWGFAAIAACGLGLLVGFWALQRFVGQGSRAPHRPEFAEHPSPPESSPRDSTASGTPVTESPKADIAIRTLTSPGHLAVVQPEADDELTIVMFYPDLKPLQELEQ